MDSAFPLKWKAFHFKGKIERFFRTVRGQFLPELSELPTLEQLNRAFSAYLENDYHVRKHGATGMAPIDRYRADAKALRRAPENLMRVLPETGHAHGEQRQDRQARQSTL